MGGKVKAFELRELWRRYKEAGDAGARERLVVAYSPLVKFVAGRIGARLPSHVEQADLISYGMVGLVEAMDRFEPGRELRFESFAMHRIRGAIIDELRSLDWVPRSVRARARDIEAANSSLEHELGRAPTDAELAERLKLSEAELQEALLQIANSSILALEELWITPDASGDRVSLLDTLEDENAPDPQAALDEREINERLSEAIQDLPERETLVVALYNFENLTLREIGEVLGVTESRVSQLHSKAVLRLRSRLKSSG
jgi:RNA polymerase sigma factor FliA